MDQSHSESDVSLSPSQILDRLNKLRQLQILQRGKLQQQRLQYQESPEITSSITEIVSHFGDSTSYNTFRSLLESSQETQNNGSSQLDISSLSKRENLHNVIDGVSVLNISESEVITNSSTVTRSSNSEKIGSDNILFTSNIDENKPTNKQISLDDMPILSPKKDFETLLTEKLKNDTNLEKGKNIVITNNDRNIKRPFLRRGEGTARYGVQKTDFVIQNTKSLPWRKKTTKLNCKPKNSTVNLKEKPIKISNTSNPLKKLKSLELKINSEPQENYKQIVKQKVIEPLTKPQTKLEINKNVPIKENNLILNKIKDLNGQTDGQADGQQNNPQRVPFFSVEVQNPNKSTCITRKVDEYIQKDKGKTWAAVLTKEQDDLLKKLKQSDYYKNFESPTKSIVSNLSYDEDYSRFKQEKEIAEQNMFELLENKVCHESFNIHNSFFNRFLRNNNLECSGESTPLIMQKYLSKNPNLLHIFPKVQQRPKNDCSHDCDTETCNSECTEFSENCSTFSSCCSCKTVTQTHLDESCIKNCPKNEKGLIEKVQESQIIEQNCKEQKGDNVTAENETINANMMEMNSKLIATSELLRDRLKELEDEIETFKKENANLTKMREEVDLERQKFYEEKNIFEQKFNEEKILSEYYLAEEKEKLNKQKQMYERYVRDMRGRLNKKEKDEIITLKKEIHDLREEIKIKDAKSTSTIARLRNQLKLMEKDKKSLEEEIEKLKKENRRIQHSNEMTRRLTNIKYLEQINKKLTNMATKDCRSEVDLDSNIKYKTFEIERQSRAKKTQHLSRGPKQRAKSVPNLHVTSRYAKYFSQKDSLSEKEKNKLENHCKNISDDNISNIKNNIYDDSDVSRSNSPESEDENRLETIYNERFKSISPVSSTKSISLYDHINKTSDKSMHSNEFFLQKSSVSQKSASSGFMDSQPPSNSISANRFMNGSKSSLNISNENDLISNFEPDSNIRNKSPVSILSNRSSSSLKCGTIISKPKNLDTLAPSPEPLSSRSSLTKTKLSPTEITKPDGSKELRFPNGNIKLMSADGKYSKFIYYNGDIKENFYNEGRIKYYYAETKTYHTTHPDGLEVLEFPDGQVEKRYKDGSSEIRLPNGSIRYYDPKNEHVREEWRFPDGAALTVSANGTQRIVFANGQVEVHAKDHKRREYPDGTVKLVYNDGTSETRYASGRVRIKDKHGSLIMDSASG